MFYKGFLKDDLSDKKPVILSSYLKERAQIGRSQILIYYATMLL